MVNSDIFGGRNIHKDQHHCRNCIGDTWLLFSIRERKRNSTLLIQFFQRAQISSNGCEIASS